MKNFLSPRLLDSFIERAVEALPSGIPPSSPDCESLGKVWKQHGLRPGDLVLLCLPNCKELLHQYFGVLMAGGVPALLPPLMPAARLREIATAMGAFAIGGLRLSAGDLGAESYNSIGPLRIAILKPPPEPAGAPGEVVLMTSGTSGVSSGCVFDFEAILLNGQRHVKAIGQGAADTVLVTLPMFFSFALSAQALSSLACGNRLIISGPPFSVGGYRKALEDYSITVSSLTPVGVRAVLKSDASVIAGLRVFSVGGDALEPDLVAQLVELRKGKDVYLTYGLTQAGPRVSTLAAHAEPSSRYSSVGLPHDGTTVSLHPVGDGSGRKQLYVNSATVMKRSIGRVEGRTNNDLVAPQTIATGDSFDQDQEGYLFYKGRLSDFISRKGEKISLAAVRRLAAGLPHVVSAKTHIIKHGDGTEDYDLELRVDASAHASEEKSNLRGLLNGLLQRTEMPRAIHIEPANEMDGQRYK
ncbi:MAG: class I adenylate-forming enzyme family protein [Terracidiphilus sp.]|jgi:acyl-CoA synthetase (AMP-forming)/AMP-acid ligase II